MVELESSWRCGTRFGNTGDWVDDSESVGLFHPLKRPSFLLTLRLTAAVPFSPAWWCCTDGWDGAEAPSVVSSLGVLLSLVAPRIQVSPLVEALPMAQFSR